LRLRSPDFCFLSPLLSSFLCSAPPLTYSHLPLLPHHALPALPGSSATFSLLWVSRFSLHSSRLYSDFPRCLFSAPLSGFVRFGLLLPLGMPLPEGSVFTSSSLTPGLSLFSATLELHTLHSAFSLSGWGWEEEEDPHSHHFLCLSWISHSAWNFLFLEEFSLSHSSLSCLLTSLEGLPLPGSLVQDSHSFLLTLPGKDFSLGGPGTQIISLFCSGSLAHHLYLLVSPPAWSLWSWDSSSWVACTACLLSFTICTQVEFLCLGESPLEFSCSSPGDLWKEGSFSRCLFLCCCILHFLHCQTLHSRHHFWRFLPLSARFSLGWRGHFLCVFTLDFSHLLSLRFLTFLLSLFH